MSDYTPAMGHAARADFIRDEDMIPCSVCGAREPVRLGRDRAGVQGCSECRDYSRCFLCRRWTFEETGAATSRNVDFGGRIVAVCDVCWERGEEGISLPLDMTEDEPDREGQPEFNGAFG